MLGFRRWELNQQMCNNCFKRVDAHQGGAEIPVSLLFVDVKDSTGIAEDVSASEFTARLNTFYGVVLEAVDAERGIVDHMAGDGVMAMWIPAFVGEDHSKHAIAAARRIAVGMSGEMSIGIGVHSGTAYVGVVGHGGAKDFTALGDVPNTASRLSSSAEAGQVVVSEASATAANLDTSRLEHQSLGLKGKSEPFSAWAEAPMEESDDQSRDC
jgi:adenylate cyclase